MRRSCAGVVGVLEDVEANRVASRGSRWWGWGVVVDEHAVGVLRNQTARFERGAGLQCGSRCGFRCGFRCGSFPARCRARVCVVAGVGLLFEIWIVDASIFVARAVGWRGLRCCVCLLHALIDCVGVCGFFVACYVCTVCLVPAVGLVGVGLVVCVTSCEGHVVDALASRADEGRRSLR